MTNDVFMHAGDDFRSTKEQKQPPNPFDVSRLTISQDFLEATGVKRVLTTIPVRKPSKEWFVRTHPDPRYHFRMCVIELKEESQIYLVDRSLWPSLAEESTFSPRLLVLSINRQGGMFLWPIRLADSTGRIDDWNASALDAAKLATDQWVRVQSNRSLGMYESYVASGAFTDPVWAVESESQVLELAFKTSFITHLDHPVIKRLRGEV